MGIGLPPELTEVAAKAGVRWPAADEDQMRRSAESWRDAARSLRSLAGEADSTAQGALRSFHGEAADAAGREWGGMVGEDGVLPSSVRGCAAAADRLDTAAQRIGETKVELVRELTALARQHDVAEQAAKAGHPQALAALDTAVRGTSANVARLHHDLAADVGSAVGPVEAEGVRTAGEPARGPMSTVEGRLPGAQEAPAEAAPGTQQQAGGWGAGAQRAMGAVAAEASGVPDEAGHVNSDTSTGPIPAVGGPGRHFGGGADAASTTAPHAVHAAWAAQPAGPQSAFAPGTQQPGGFAGPPAPNAGGVAAPQPGSRPSGPVPGGFGQAPAARPAPGPRPPGPPPNQAPPVNQVVRRAPLMPPRSPAPPSAPAEAPQRGLRSGPRNADAVAFVLHQFPIGHMPVAAHGASEQLPPPESEQQRPGLSFPPQDHPQSRLVTDAEALARARSGELYHAARQRRAEPDEPRNLPDSLLSGHDRLGELSEIDWEHRYTTRDGEQRGLRWPPAEDFPEGGHEPGDPVVLEPGTVLDLLGAGTGRVLYTSDTPFAHRSLPAEHAERAHRSYRVVRPLPVWRSVAAPWFEQPGGGVRYRTTYPADDLVELGHLVELTPARRLAEASTLRIRMSGQAQPVGDDEQEAEQ